MSKVRLRGRRRRGPRPFRQGDLDGLCGVYSVINAVRLLCPELDTAGAEWLFECLILALDRGGADPSLSVTGGLNMRVVRHLLNEAIAEMAAEYDVVLKARRLPESVRRSKSITCVWQELADVLSPTCVAVIGVFGRRSHWTVGWAATPQRLRLFDSGRMMVLRRRDCTVGKAAKRNGLSAPCVVLVERKV